MGFNLILLLVYAAVIVIASLITFLLYGKDKKMSAKGTEVRIKEKTLLGWAAFGGALGAFLGRLAFHHKTDKIYFSIVIYFSLLLQAAVLVLGLISLAF